jgi:pimeloyl-ACP methyl ester carboxylesterase
MDHKQKKLLSNPQLIRKLAWLLFLIIAILGLVASGAFASTPRTSAVKKIESTSIGTSSESIATTTILEVSQVSNSTPQASSSFIGPVNRVQIGSTFIAYRQFGTGPNLILLNDAGESMDSWGLSLLSALANSYKVTTIDYPGVGYSTDNLSKPMTVNWIASKLATLITETNIQSPIIAGSGFGGEVAIAISEAHPKLIKSLILVGTSPGSSSAYQDSAAQIQQQYGTATTYEERFQAMFPASAQNQLNSFLDPTNLLGIEPILNSTLNRELQAQQAVDASNNLLNSLSEIKSKCLVLVGDKDTIMPEQDSNLLISGLLTATKVVMPGYGHAIMQQNPTVFMQQLSNFLNS